MTATPRRPAVILAEDDTTTRMVVSAMIADFGYAVTSAVNGEHAWEAFRASPADIVITDWLMPGLDGIDLCRRIRETSGDRCFIMVVTSRDSRDSLRVALEAGVDDYVSKPIVREQLQARMVIAERQLALAQARRDAEEALARMRWLAGIGQAVLTFQHEVNNPLLALYGHLDFLLADADLPPTFREEIEGAMTQARRIADTVKHLATVEQHTIVEPIAGAPMLAVGASPFVRPGSPPERAGP